MEQRSQWFHGTRCSSFFSSLVCPIARLGVSIPCWFHGTGSPLSPSLLTPPFLLELGVRSFFWCTSSFMLRPSFSCTLSFDRLEGKGSRPDAQPIHPFSRRKRGATMAAARSHLPSTANSALYSFLLFVITLSLQQVYKEKLASSELYTILGGFVASLLFILVLTFVGNIQESLGTRTGWGAVIFAELVAATAAGAVHRVCVTTCVIFSVGLLYELNKLSSIAHQQPEPIKKKAY